MAAFLNVAVVVLVLQLLTHTKLTTATWCVARNDVAQDTLQKALDYACGSGADCGPVQETGPCFLPNTLQAHASYAFNSFYMHSSMDPSACDFDGTATVAKTDPSYGSCVYPASPSTAEATKNPPLDTVLPPPQNGVPLDGSVGALTPLPGALITPTGMAPAFENSPSSEAFTRVPISRMLFMGLIFMVLFVMF